MGTAHLTFYLLIAVLRRQPEFTISLCNLSKEDEIDLFVISAFLTLEAFEGALQAVSNIMHNKEIAIDFVVLVNIGLFVRFDNSYQTAPVFEYKLEQIVRLIDLIEYLLKTCHAERSEASNKSQNLSSTLSKINNLVFFNQQKPQLLGKNFFNITDYR